MTVTTNYLVTGNGITGSTANQVQALVSGGGNVPTFVRNPSALRRAQRRLTDGINTYKNIGVFGDSLIAGTGATGGANADETGDTYGLVGRLRYFLNSALGTKGGGWMSAQDLRVTKSGGAALAGYGPLYSSSHNNTRTLTASGHTLSFALPSCTAYDVSTWEDFTANYGRTTSQFSYGTDGGGATTLSGAETSGANSTFRLIAGPTGLSDSTHTALLSWVAGNNAINGLLYRYATGINVLRYGVGGFTSADILGRTLSAAGIDRIKRANYQHIPLDVAIVRISHNDCSQQITQGTTPAVTVSNLNEVITLLRANSGSPIIILMTDPATSATPPGSFAYEDYWEPIAAIATGSDDVCAIVAKDFLGTFAQMTADGTIADTVHLNNRGYAAEAQYLAQVLLAAQPR